MDENSENSGGAEIGESVEIRDSRVDGPRGGSPEPVLGRCGAKLRRSEPPSYCRRFPIQGRVRCRLHGGVTPRGIQSVNYKGRGYSKDLPARLLERMMDGIDDPDLTSLRTELKLLDARMGELFSLMSDAGTEEAWGAVRDVGERLRYVVDRPDLDDREVVLDTLTVKLTTACDVMTANERGWKEIYSLIDRIRRTAAVESKREQNEEHTLLATQSLFLMQQLLNVIQVEVEDAGIKARIAAGFAKAMNRPEPIALLGPGDL